MRSRILLAMIFFLLLLSIHETKATEDGLKSLEGLTKLETLYLCSPVSKVGYPSLKKLESLQSLYIGSAMLGPDREWLQKELGAKVRVY